MKIQSILFFCLLCFSQSLFAQREAAESFEIGKIAVVGNELSDARAIVAYSGLQVGTAIKLPGLQTANAIKALMKTQLFTKVEIDVTRRIEEIVFLEIRVEEAISVGKVELEGLKKFQKDELLPALQMQLKKGTIITQQNLRQAEKILRKHFEEKGYDNVAIVTDLATSPQKPSARDITYTVTRNKKVKINEIIFSGNTQVPTSKLRKLLIDTKSKKNPFAKSRLIEPLFKADQETILMYYRSLGYRDAQLSSTQSKHVENGHWDIQVSVEEGEQYHFGTIDFHGNAIYTTEFLQEVMGIEAGDVYNETLLQKKLYFNDEGPDITGLYMDQGHLFFKLQLIEKGIRGNQIDLEVRLNEGPLATIGKVEVKGNKRTNQEVILRELRTQPGETFSRADILRSQRELTNLGYFKPDKMDVQTSVNADDNTVDLVYEVEESRNEKIELAGGWQPSLVEGKGGSVTGTLGLSVKNFSVKNLMKGQAPIGDGQHLSMRVQSDGSTFYGGNFSFTEPWLGGKKPNYLTVGGFYNQYSNGQLSTSESYQSLGVLGGSVGLSSRANWMGDYWVTSTALSYQRYDLNGLQSITLDDRSTINEGLFNNLSIKQSFSRNSLNHPIFPTKGSLVSFSVQATPPFSLLGQTDSEDNPFKLMEYHKWSLKAEKYITLGKKQKWTLALKGKFGGIGHYNSDLGTPPFERFVLQPAGLGGTATGITGNDLIAVRGYERAEFETNSLGGASIYNKFTAELRYPIFNQGFASGYAHVFVEGVNAYDDWKSYNPFELKRSFGAGIRINTPMLGLIGVDYGFGIDQSLLQDQKWYETGKLSLILGIEPD